MTVLDFQQADQDNLPTLGKEIESLLDNSQNRYVVGQKKRIKLSLRYASKYGVVKGKVLDVGGHSGGEVREAWVNSFPSAEITPTVSDLHDTFPFADQSFDGAICGEIFEHIGDTDGYRTSIRNFSGAIKFLLEVMRVMKPGGRCILTTPNASSFKNVALAMCNVHPYMYPLHYREYTKRELERLIHFTGANIVAFDTLDAFRQADEFVESIKRFCVEHRLPMEDRGNDNFVVFERPPNWSRPEVPENTALIVYPEYRRGKMVRPWMPGADQRYEGEV